MAIVGPSGCGKSTVMKLATGLQFPVLWHGDRRGRARDAPVKLAGMAFQNPTMLPWRTTLQNLLLPLEIVEPHRSAIRRRKAEYVAKAEALLDAGRPRRSGREISMAALRRHAAARLALPRADPRAEASDARRALRRARRLHARGAVVRDPRPPRRAGRHGRPRHARPARGDLPRRSHLLHERASGPHHRRARGRSRAASRPRGHLHAGFRRASCSELRAISRRRGSRHEAQERSPRRSRRGCSRSASSCYGRSPAAPSRSRASCCRRRA